MKNILLALSVFSFIFSSNPLQAQWDWLNPLPNGASILSIHMNSDSLGFFINGIGLYRTDDGGDSWNIIKSMRYPNNNRDMDFKDGIGVIVGSNSKAYISRDEGDTWTDLTIPANESFNSVDIINVDTIAVSSASHIYLSYDGGINWQSRLIPLSNPLAVTAHFITGNIGHVACLKGYLLRTLDGGISWDTTATSNTTSSNYRDIYFINENIGFAVREFTNVNVTRDGGNTWQRSSQNFRDVYAIEFIDELTGFFVCEAGVIYKTVDAGQNWVGSAPGGGFQYDDFYAVGFSDKDNGFIAGRKGRIMKTTNGGLDWQAFSPYYYRVSDITFPSQNVGYAMGYEKLLKTVDNGDTWIPQADSINAFSNLIFFNKDTGLVSAGSGDLFKTTDGGQNWNKIFTKSGFLPIREMFFVDQDTGFISGDVFGLDRYLEVTHDGGNTWSKITTSPKSFDHLFFLNSQLGFGVSDIGLYKTIDGGLSWEKDSMVNSRDLIDITFPSDSTGYVLDYEGIVYRTTDQGNSWDTLKVYNNDLTSISFQDEMNGFVTGKYNWYFVTNDGGDSWRQKGMVGFVYSSCIDPLGQIFVGGDNGLIARNSGFYVVNSVFEKGEISPSIKIYPNPSSGRFHVELENQSAFDIKIFDLFGKLIYAKHNVEDPYIDLGTNLQGLFLIQIDSGGNQYAGKLMFR